MYKQICENTRLIINVWTQTGRGGRGIVFEGSISAAPERLLHFPRGQPHPHQDRVSNLQKELWGRVLWTDATILCSISSSDNYASTGSYCFSAAAKVNKQCISISKNLHISYSFHSGQIDFGSLCELFEDHSLQRRVLPTSGESKQSLAGILSGRPYFRALFWFVCKWFSCTLCNRKFNAVRAWLSPDSDWEIIRSTASFQFSFNKALEFNHFLQKTLGKTHSLRSVQQFHSHKTSNECKIQSCHRFGLLLCCQSCPKSVWLGGLVVIRISALAHLALQPSWTSQIWQLRGDQNGWPDWIVILGRLLSDLINCWTALWEIHVQSHFPSPNVRSSISLGSKIVQKQTVLPQLHFFRGNFFVLSPRPG